MELKWMAVLLVGIMVLAGCAGSGPANGGANANGGNANAGAGANAGANVNPNGGGGNAGGSPNGGGSGNAGGSPNGGGSGANGAGQALGFAALQALGVPTQCTLKMAGQPDSTMYVKGTNVRMETPMTLNGQTYNTVSIIRADGVYEDTKALGAGAAGCDWLVFEANATQTPGQPETGAVDKNTLNGLPATDFSCAPGVFGDEKFATPGKVCTTADMMANAYKSATSNMTPDQKAAVCASITDPQTRTVVGCS